MQFSESYWLRIGHVSGTVSYITPGGKNLEKLIVAHVVKEFTFFFEISILISVFTRASKRFIFQVR
jgi:hypothetical protein